MVQETAVEMAEPAGASWDIALLSLNKSSKSLVERNHIAQEDQDLKYKVYSYYDPEYKGYVADVLDLPGCIG